MEIDWEIVTGLFILLPLAYALFAVVLINVAILLAGISSLSGKGSESSEESGKYIQVTEKEYDYDEDY